MFPQSTLRTLNCSHNIDRFFEIGSKWSKEDFCLSCVESIEDVEEHNQAQSE